MHITKEQVPVKIDVPGATARQAGDFGAEYFSLGAGTDADVALFSPQREHMEVMDHMLKQMAAT